MSELPRDWVACTLGDVAQITTGTTPPTSTPENYGDAVPFVKPGDLDQDDPITRTVQALSTEGASLGRVVRKGAVLVSCIGNLGKVGIAGTEVVTNQQINAVEFDPSLVDDKYGYYYCKTLGSWMKAESSATTVRILNKRRFSAAPIVFPALREQRRIAAKLDVLFSKRRSLLSNLTSIPETLKRFREAVLEAAVSGRLTGEWRAAHSSSTDAWTQMHFEEASEYITVGHVGKMVAEYRPAGVPFLRSLNVRPFAFDRRQLQFVSLRFHETLPKSALRPGDVVVVRSGAPGQCCVIPEELPEANCSDLVIVRPKGILNPYYACIFINAAQSQQFVRSEQVGVAQAHFNVGSMKKAPLRLPPLAEQVEIVRRVDKVFSLVDLLHRTYETALAGVGKLTPAVLAKAFRGELVPQEPKEPVSVMQENYENEKAGSRAPLAG